MTFAIDAGATYFRGEIYEDDKLFKKIKQKSSKAGLGSWIESTLKDNQNIKTICISYAGQIKDGVIISAPNIDIDIHEIKNYFLEKYNIKLFIQNDVNCAVLAEANYFQENDICAIYIGTGLGLGVVSSSKLITGFSGVATELGHIPYKKTPFKCGCGKDNCIELFASGSALDRWKKYENVDLTLTLEELRDKSDNKIYEEFEKGLLYAVSIAITLFNPKILVFGGGIIESNQELSSIISAKLGSYAMPDALENIKVVSTKLKDAPLIGALMLKAKFNSTKD